MPPKTHAMHVPGIGSGGSNSTGRRTGTLSQLAPLQVPGAAVTYHDDIGAEVLPSGYRRVSGDRALPSLDETRPINITSQPGTDGDKTIGDAGDQYLPDDFTFEGAAGVKSMLMSPTLGLSQHEWKSIPFSTRQKLKKDVEAALESGSPIANIDSYKDLPQNLSQALKSAPVSLAGSLTSGGSSGATSPYVVSSPRTSMPIPAKPLSKRLKERSATLNYPSTTAPDLHNRTTRSTSVSNFAESPAFAFLKQWKEATTGTLGTVGSEGECDEGEQVGDYVLGPVIGYGGFSEIKEAHTIDPETGKKVIRAVKLLRKNNPLSSRERLAIVQSEFEHEVAIWKQLDHPNILKLLYVEEDEKATYCITERITGGTLFEFCRSMITKPQRKDVVLKYARQLGSAILYLHDSKGIVHRDIKLENCLLESKGSGEFDLLLCDFGMSEYFTRDTEGDFEVISHNDSDYIDSSSASTPRPGLIQVIGPAETSAIFSQYYLGPRPHASQRNSVAGSGGQSLSRRSSMSSTTADPADSPGPSDHFGSMPYASPELLRSDVPIIQPYVDIWSFGCTLHALLLARLPWQHSFPPKLKSLILAHEWNREGLRRRWDENAVDLLDGCFDDNPETRLTISEIMHHPFFEDTNNQVTGDRMQP